MLNAMILKKNAGIRWLNCLPEDVEQVNDTSFFVAVGNASELGVCMKYRMFFQTVLKIFIWKVLSLDFSDHP